MENLEKEVERLKNHFEEIDKEREVAYAQARQLRRTSVQLVRDIHRDRAGDVEKTLAECREMAVPLVQGKTRFGFVEEALQEYAEAALTHAFLQGQPEPTQEELGVSERTYLMGFSDAISELRRRVLILLRKDDIDAATAMFDLMDELYNLLMVFDYTDAVLPLRRKQDQLRGVIERTRADLTNIICQKRLEEKISGE